MSLLFCLLHLNSHSILVFTFCIMSTFGLIQDQSFDILDEEQATVTKTETRMVLKKKKKTM